MRITSALRLKPFSHRPGVRCVLPSTTLCFEIYPTLLRAIDIAAAEPRTLEEIPLQLKGPVEGFTAICDLERPSIRVFGHTAQGYFRYRIVPSPEPSSPFLISLEKEQLPTALFLENVALAPQAAKAARWQNANLNSQQLSLGCSKKQEWCAVDKRRTLTEIFPFWLKLGQSIPPLPEHRAGAASLLGEIKQAIDSANPPLAASLFTLLYQIGFDGILTPQLCDSRYQGIALKAPHPTAQQSPLLLLREGADLIKKLFVATDAESISLLHCCPVELHCGRFINVDAGSHGAIDLEWSKKKMRRMIFTPSSNAPLTIVFPRKIKRYRLTSEGKAQQIDSDPRKPLTFATGRRYYFDRFQG